MKHDDALAASPVAATIRLQFLEYRIDVTTNSLRLARSVHSYFREYLAPHGAPAASATLQAVAGEPRYDASRLAVWSKASSPNRTPKESYYDEGKRRYILKNRTGVLIVLDGGDATIVGDVEGNANQVVNLIGTMFGLSLLGEGYAMLHASAVVRADSDEATIFLGNSGSGKSSLALQMIERGQYEYVSNDRVLLRSTRDGVHIVGLPKKPRVNPGTLLASNALSRMVTRPKRRVYERLAPDELWRLEEKHDVDVGQVFGVRTRLTARLQHVYSLVWRPSGEGLNVQPLDAEGALAAMRVTAKDFGPYDLDGARSMDAEYARIANSVSFIEVSGKAAPTAFAERLSPIGS